MKIELMTKPSTLCNIETPSLHWKNLMIVIKNNGKNIQSTNYWGTEFADAGFCYLSSNAGCLRLLVPKTIEAVIPEMRTGKNAVLKPSMAHADAAFDVVFDDGTATPLAVSLGELLIDCHGLNTCERIPHPSR